MQTKKAKTHMQMPLTEQALWQHIQVSGNTDSTRQGASDTPFQSSHLSKSKTLGIKRFLADHFTKPQEPAADGADVEFVQSETKPQMLDKNSIIAKPKNNNASTIPGSSRGAQASHGIDDVCDGMASSRARKRLSFRRSVKKSLRIPSFGNANSCQQKKRRNQHGQGGSSILHGDAGISSGAADNKATACVGAGPHTGIHIGSIFARASSQGFYRSSNLGIFGKGKFAMTQCPVIPDAIIDDEHKGPDSLRQAFVDAQPNQEPVNNNPLHSWRPPQMYRDANGSTADSDEISSIFLQSSNSSYNLGLWSELTSPTQSHHTIHTTQNGTSEQQPEHIHRSIHSEERVWQDETTDQSPYAFDPFNMEAASFPIDNSQRIPIQSIAPPTAEPPAENLITQGSVNCNNGLRRFLPTYGLNINRDVDDESIMKVIQRNFNFSNISMGSLSTFANNIFSSQELHVPPRDIGMLTGSNLANSNYMDRAVARAQAVAAASRSLEGQIQQQIFDTRVMNSVDTLPLYTPCSSLPPPYTMASNLQDNYSQWYAVSPIPESAHGEDHLEENYDGSESDGQGPSIPALYDLDSLHNRSYYFDAVSIPTPITAITAGIGEISTSNISSRHI